MTNTNISDLLQKEMDRKDFLKTLAIGVVAVTGVSAAVRVMGSLANSSPRSQTRTADSGADAFGSSAYGGAAGK